MPAIANRVAARALPLLSAALLRHREKRREDPRTRGTRRETGPYWDVTVKVLWARHIPKLDFLSETDCYVSLRLPTASSRTYRTSTASKSRFPMWNETFRFRVHSHVKNILELNVCDEDLLNADYSTVLFDLNNLYPGRRERRVFNLDPEEKDELCVEFEMEESKEAPGTYITNGVLVAGPFSCLEVEVEETAKEKDWDDLVLKLSGAYKQEHVVRRADPGIDPDKPVLFHVCGDLETELEVHRLQEESEESTVPLRSLPAGQQVIVSVPVGQDEIDLRLKATDLSDELDVRLGFDVPVEEKSFLEKRSVLVSRTLQEVLHLPSEPKPDQVPVVAVVGSGGGARAMTGLYGSLIGLQSLGLLDAVCYITGVSGSTWAMSTLYANANWSQEGLGTAVSVLEREISKSLFGLLSPCQLAYYQQDLQQKGRSGQLVSFIDLLGLGIEYLIHGTKDHSTLSSQQRAVAVGQNPYPIYTAVNMKDNISGAEAVSEWCEFTPYEVGIPKYGGFVRAEDFGSEFYMGHLIRRHPEIRISYLLGLWSSVLSFNLQQVMFRLLGSVPSWITGLGDDIHHTDEQRPHPPAALHTYFIEPVGELAEMLDDLVTKRPVISHNYNFLRGFELHWDYSRNHRFLRWRDAHLDSFPTWMTPSDAELHLVDSGFALNSGFPPALRPERHVDLILSFDYSWHRQGFKVLRDTAQYCQDHHIPFPQIDFSSVEGGPLREVYLFKDERDPRAPIVLHFPLTNASFRQYQAPGVRRVGETALTGGDVDVESSSSPYRTVNLTYEPEDFQRLLALTAYNVRNSRATILQAFHLALRKRSPENGPAHNPSPENCPAHNPSPENGPAPNPSPENGPNPSPENCPAHNPSPENGPAHNPSPENGPAHNPSPENGPNPSPENGPAPNPTPENGPAPNPTPENGPNPTPENGPNPSPENCPAHNPSPENGPAPNPTPENGPAPNPTPENGPNPTPENCPAHNPSPENSPAHNPSPENCPAPNPSPENGPAPNPAPENGPAPNPSPENGPAPNPSPENSPAHNPAPENGPAPNSSPENGPAPNPSPEYSTSQVHKRTPEGTGKPQGFCALL